MSPIETYLRQLAEGLDALPPREREECLREVRGHLEDAAAGSPAPTPAAREADAVERFGPVDEIARTLANEVLMGAASRGLRPVATAKAIAHALLGGTSWTAFGILLSAAYIALLLIGMVSIARLWMPGAGLWIHDHGGWSLSFAGFDNAVEVLGPWLPLYGPLGTLLGWGLLNLLVRRVIKAVSSRRRLGAGSRGGDTIPPVRR